ncbi:MAG: dihydrofolate synthase / folylpolyglutamate synthase [Actinomycetota bacterium]|nr:dihydrofolate synthase / folylpolyglutamate synthase [Actinomycetota bacterium]
MDYGEALRWLDDRVNLEASSSASRLAAPTLERMQELVGLLAEPQRGYPVIHLTGTNGKTSTARMMTRLLEVAGLTVGTYISPHLETINERISRNGVPISDEDLAETLTTIAGVAPLMQSGRPSYFEALTAAGFLWFADVAVHAAVVEVGLLGRWDATNVADGQVAVVTNIGADHLDYAGSIDAVAREKAGIVKPGSILVLGETNPELVVAFADTPAEEVWRRDDDFAVLDNSMAVGGRLVTMRTPSSMYEDVFVRLHGAHQADNAILALSSAEAFLGGPLDSELVAEAFDTVASPGRLEVMGHEPLVLLDGAHNAAGATALASAMEDEFSGGVERWTLVVGLLEPHSPLDFLGALDVGGSTGSEVARVVATEANSPRAVPAAAIVQAARSFGIEAEVGGGVAESVARALALSEGDEAVLVTGSLWVVGEARTALRRGVG